MYGPLPCDAHRVEEHAERLVALEDQQVEADSDDADQLGGEPDPGDTRPSVLRAREVEAERDHAGTAPRGASVDLLWSTGMSNRLARKPLPNSATAVIVTIMAQM